MKTREDLYAESRACLTPLRQIVAPFPRGYRARENSCNMLIYYRTSIFESPSQSVVNTVNRVGVMGTGIAAEFRKRYPEMNGEYRKICE
jgi:hypothetical protein